MKKIIQLQDLQPGTKYLVRARVSNKYDFVSEWSQTYELNVVKDGEKPSKPAKPTIQIAGPQKIVVSHDNTKQGGGSLEFDVVSYKVFTNTTSSNSGGTLIHTMSATRPGSGLNSFATINVNAPLVGGSAQTLYFYVTAVDSAGNESDPSDATTGTPITYFDSAYISELTADKIRTGTLQANQSISVGTVAPIIIKSNENTPRGQIYIGTTVNPTGAEGSGYKDPQTAFYVDSTGKFSLKDKLYWDGDTLTIDGYFQIGDEETTISGNQIRTGNLISSNYESNVPGQPQAQSTSYTNAGTWIDLDDGTIYSKNFYIDPQGSAVFRGNIFGSRGIFNGLLPSSQIPNLTNPSGARVPTLIVESTNTDDGYLVFFKNAGTDSGVEFYVKQGDGTNWRRGSLSHLSDGNGGFLRLGAFPSSTGDTPGRIRIYAENSTDGKQGEIYLDAKRTYIQKMFLTQPTTNGDWLNDPITNFWKDPDSVGNGQTFFTVGSNIDSGISVKKTSAGLPKVEIKDFNIVGVTKIIDQSSISIVGVSEAIDLIKIGKNVGGTNRDGISINSNNYWTLNNDGSNVNFRVGDTSSNFLFWNGSTLTVSGNINVTGGNAATQSYADTAASTAAASIVVRQKLNNEMVGTTITSLGEIYSLNKTSYTDTDNGWYIGWIDPSNPTPSNRTPAFNIGNASKYIKWDGSQLIINGTAVAGTALGESNNIIIDDPAQTYKGIIVKSTAQSNPVAIQITPDVGGGQILFLRGTASDGALFSTYGSKFADSSSGAGVALGNPVGYPFLEVGWTDTGRTSPKVSIYSQANVGLELRSSNFILRGGVASRIRGIGTTNSIPAGKRILYGNDVDSTNDELIWGPVPEGGGGANISLTTTLSTNLLSYNSTTGVLGLPVRAANLVFAGPSSGADDNPSFRSLVADDLPASFVNSVGTNTINGLSLVRSGRTISLSGSITSAAAYTNGTAPGTANKITYSGSPPLSGRTNGDIHFVL